MRRRSDHEAEKSLADILEEELNGEAIVCKSPAEDENQRLRKIFSRIHALETKRTALCLSGGGIRSASFSLGVLQALARARLLEKFDYLSTVSGGGYIGSWLTAWMHHHPGGREAALADLRTSPDVVIEPERDPIRHLRAFSNYLTPQLGFFSTDTWTLVATVLRNILLNWIVLVSWLAALLLIPRFAVVAANLSPGPGTLNALLVAAFAGIMIATAYAGIDLPSLGNARWAQGSFIVGWLVPMLMAAACYLEWWACYRNSSGLAGPMMLDGPGLMYTQLFVGTATAAGCLLSAIVFTVRTRGWRMPVPPVSKLLELAGNVFVTVVLTGLLSGLLVWWVAAHVFPAPASEVRNFICFGVPLLLGLYFTANALFIGLTSWVANDQDREWWGRAGAWILSTIAAWAVLNFLVLWAPPLVSRVDIGALGKSALAAAGGVAGLVTAFLGFSGKSGAIREFGGSRTKLLAIAALAFFVLLSCLLSRLLDVSSSAIAVPGNLFFDWARGPFLHYLRFLAALAGVGLIMGFFINVNRFSLHAMYRNRLIRAFLGASRLDRRPHWFTGFDPRDNFDIADLKPGRPFHIINMALNLVKGDQIGWQERMAASFTVSRLHSGSWLLGYRPSDEYGNGISLGSAVAISGAAANPNQGYHSSPLVAFLMTLFNVRLGWWLGNPGPAGHRTWKRPGPMHAALPLFAEALGNTTDAYAYVNLSDGGHFENLGLYEMVLRRCRHIVVIDAGCDCDYVFEDLGNAVRKIRIDLGIPIEIHSVSPKKEGATASYFALGKICYSAVDGPGTDGELLYIKPILCGEEPADIAHYAAAHPEFPHESTADQWFSESQFESYRALGFHAISAVTRGSDETTSITAFFDKLSETTTPKVSDGIKEN